MRRLANDGVTVFLTTQYLEEADVLADRVGIIDRGTIVAEGTPAELKASIGRPSVEVIPQDPGDRERLGRRCCAASASRRPPRATASPRGCRRASATSRRSCARWTRRASQIADLRLHTPTLDDVFLAKTGRSLEGAGDGEGDGEAGDGNDAGTSDGGGLERRRHRRMSLLSTQVGVLARRSMLKTLRQPFQLFPIVFFPLILLAVNASGLKAATHLPGFPTHSYISFAIAVAFIQGGMFSLINTGTTWRRTSRAASSTAWR